MHDNSLRNLLRTAAALAVVATIACSDDKKPTTPVEPEPPEMITQTFNGELPEKSESCHFFTIGADGDIITTITALMPLSSLTVGLGIGAPSEADADGCSRFGTDDSVRINETYQSANNGAGDYCVCLLDVGNIFPGEIVTYALDVTHPK